MKFHPSELPDLAGKVYIVTGGNSGIGYNTVARLAEKGAHVYLCARSSTKGSAAIEQIKTTQPFAHITLLIMDHLSLDSINKAAKIFLSKETALHGLINNAGIMCTPFEMSQDGFEAQWQTNHLAHWVFTSLLLPLMLKTSQSLPAGSVRIVNISSSGHWSAPKQGIDFDDTSLKSSDSNMARYGQSKLANVLHIKALHRLYGPDSPSAKAGRGEIWVSAVHPGLVQSNLGIASTFPSYVKTFFTVFAPLISIDADTGSWTSLFCAASPKMTSTQSGMYFQRLASPGWQSGLAKNEELAVKLEEWTKNAMEKGGWTK